MDLKTTHAMFCMYTHNMRMLHWFSTGKHFNGLHDTCNEYYEKMSEDIDFIAELCMMHDVEPCAYSEVSKVLDSSDMKFYELVPADYKCKSVYFNCKMMFETIIEALDKIKERLSSDEVSEIETIQYYYRKELQYKIKRRLKDD